MGKIRKGKIKINSKEERGKERKWWMGRGTREERDEKGGRKGRGRKREGEGRGMGVGKGEKQEREGRK